MLIILGRLKEEKMTSPLLVDLADVNKAMALCKDMPDIQSALKLMLPQPVNSAESSGSGSGSGEGGYSAGSGKLYLISTPTFCPRKFLQCFDLCCCCSKAKHRKNVLERKTPLLFLKGCTNNKYES